MKKVLQRFLSGMMSAVTIALIMASPIAAMVYSAETIETNQQVPIKDNSFEIDLKPSSSYREQLEEQKPRQLEAPVPWDEKNAKTNKNKKWINRSNMLSDDRGLGGPLAGERRVSKESRSSETMNS